MEYYRGKCLLDHMYMGFMDSKDELFYRQWNQTTTRKWQKMVGNYRLSLYINTKTHRLVAVIEGNAAQNPTNFCLLHVLPK